MRIATIASSSFTLAAVVTKIDLTRSKNAKINVCLIMGFENELYSNDFSPWTIGVLRENVYVLCVSDCKKKSVHSNEP